jgi:hypothetical protein
VSAVVVQYTKKGGSASGPSSRSAADLEPATHGTPCLGRRHRENRAKSKKSEFLLFYTATHGYPDLLHEIGAFDMKHTLPAYVVSFWVLGLKFQEEL